MSNAIKLNSGNLTQIKTKVKTDLQRYFKLPLDRKVSLIGFVGRLDKNQKGIDVLHRAILRANMDRCQFVIVGQGEKDWEERFANLALLYPNHVAASTLYSDNLERLIYAGCDFVIIPSHFEPCCLIQMKAMRFGTIPIARTTGGLKDRIKNNINGYLYTRQTSTALQSAIRKALTIKNNYPMKHASIVRSAVGTNFSWDTSAQRYVALYHRAVKH